MGFRDEKTITPGEREILRNLAEENWVTAYGALVIIGLNASEPTQAAQKLEALGLLRRRPTRDPKNLAFDFTELGRELAAEPSATR
jgi:hypothetical protein